MSRSYENITLKKEIFHRVKKLMKGTLYLKCKFIYTGLRHRYPLFIVALQWVELVEFCTTSPHYYYYD